MKSIQLKLTKVKYSGSSVGDDIRIEIGVLGQFLRVDKKIKIGTSAKINQEVGRFEADEGLFNAKVSITVIEKDLLFNDTGSLNSDIKIDPNAEKTQQVTYKVRVKETRSIVGKIWGERTADFEITLEAIIGDIELYIPNSKDGWLRALDAKSKEAPLPAYLKVKFEYIKNKREYFTPLEGAYRGQLLSVKLQDNDSSYFISRVKHQSMARATYSINKKALTLNGKKYLTVDYKHSPWKKGLYDIEIPDHPHPGGRNYTKVAPHSKVWFRVGHTGDRYIHAGSHSLGCITVTEHSKWEEIYNIFIKARKGDFVSIGTLEVID